jgi:transposase-like protein
MQSNGKIGAAGVVYERSRHAYGAANTSFLPNSCPSAAQRDRRKLSAEFKAEAVRLVAMRRAIGVTVAQVGRELDVRPDLLRTWARQQSGEHDTGARRPGETLEQEIVGSGGRTRCRGRSRPSLRALHHSDRGSQYAAGAYRAELAAHGMLASMSRKGDC